MVVNSLSFNLERTLRLGESDKLDRSDSSLVQQLEKTMLSIGARFSEIDNCSIPGDHFSFVGDALSIAFHV